VGAQLVAQALIYALPKLEPNKHDRARVVFLVMCQRSKDTDRNPTYFAGSEVLANALGFAPADKAGSRAVERAIAQLVEADLVAQIGRTSARGKRRWGLKLPLLKPENQTETSPNK